MHNYLDVNYRRPWRRSGTRRMLRLTRGKLWISETAGIVYYVRSGRLGERHAARATRWMLSLPSRSHRIKRVYAYQWQAQCHPRLWDSAFFRSNGRRTARLPRTGGPGGPRAAPRSRKRSRHSARLRPGAYNTCAEG